VKSIREGTAARVAAALVMALLAAVAQAQTYNVLYKFKGNPDGANPPAGLIQDAMGNFYGITEGGGVSNGGTVFKLSKTGETVLYSFCPGGPPCTDGAGPAGLIQDAPGNFYGTAYGGTGCGGTGCGVVFKLDTTGKETVLYNFCLGGIPCADGEGPTRGLIQDASGNFYGTTSIGGNTGCANGYGCGTVFKLDVNGKETVLHMFSRGADDGAYPGAGVIQDSEGNLYGTTFQGGAYNRGTVFKLNNAGVLTVLYSFRPKLPYSGGPGGLIQDAVGNLYGTNWTGGENNNGQVFKVGNTGKETVLYRFKDGADGQFPAGVIRDSKGNLYGTTVYGNRCGHHGGCGVVFKLNKTGKLTVLHSMTGGADGRNPYGGVIRDAEGNLYGTTFYGGDLSCGQGQGCGLVFKLTP
jgi:uncharacterized repeat protein (TIGR03803 family)